MIFKRFLSRRKKIVRLPEDQEALIQVVRTDEDTAKRMDACRRISRLGELRTLADADVDAGVREIAQARYRKLLCGVDEDAPSRPERVAEIANLGDQRSLEHIAANAVEPEVRLAAINCLTTPEALAACAVNDPVTANRSAAVERLEDKTALEQVVRRIGKKDKNVYRIVRRKIKEINEREALPERIRCQCEELCEKLERLGRFENWVQDRALLDLLDRQWAEIEPQADDDWRAGYASRRGRFLAAYEVYRREHEAQVAEEENRAANRSARNGLIDELVACASLGDEQTLHERASELDARWTALALLPEKEQRAMDRRYRTAGDDAATRLESLQSQRKAAARLGKLLDSARRSLEQSKPLDRAQIQNLFKEATPLLDAPGMGKAIVESFGDSREKLAERLRKQVQHAEERLARAETKLAELTAAVESGELKQAEPLFQSLQASVDLAERSGLPRKRFAPIGEQLRSMAPKVRDLQKWRKWGADTHRNGLCQTMEELEGADLSLEAKALRLHDLQMEWKGLDKGGSPVNHPLWDRFHAASEKVYACCKPYLDQQAAEREAARIEREALCKQLEDFLDQVDWERIDWKQTQRAERDMRRSWAGMGEVEGRHRRTLEKRFRGSLKRLDDKLSAERAANQQLKRGLIEDVETLVEEPDLERAIEETKRLQREWHTTVPARQKDENKQWQRFRSACDAVFARRRQQHETFAAQLDENLKTREAICAEAESLARSDLDPTALNAELRSIENRWHDTDSLPVPRQAVSRLDRRWQETRARVQERHRELLDGQRRASLDLLARQAGVCARLEHAVESGRVDPADTAAAEAAWQGLPVHPDKDLQQGIEARYQFARRAVEDGGEALRAALADNGKRRAELCLHLEILAQVDSPPELTQERLAFQVNRLKGHMRAGEKDPLIGASRPLETWYLFGSAPAADSPGLEQRFARARAALEQTSGEPAS